MLRPISALVAEPRVTEHEALLHPENNSVRGLVDMLKTLPTLSLVIEIGSYRGVSTEALAHFCNRVIAVDPWVGMDRAKREFDARLGSEARVSALRMQSTEAAWYFKDGIADLVYIDADHQEHSVVADIRAWRPKVRKGGWIAGHDYSEEVSGGGVIRAVQRELGRPDAVFADWSWIKHLK